MFHWIADNKVFSGFAGAVLTGVIALMINGKKKDKNKPTQSIKSGDDSNNIQGGKDVNVTIGDRNVRK